LLDGGVLRDSAAEDPNMIIVFGKEDAALQKWISRLKRAK